MIISSTDWYTIHKLYMCLHKGYNTSIMTANFSKNALTPFNHWPWLYMHSACMTLTLCTCIHLIHVDTLLPFLWPNRLVTCLNMVTVLTMLGRERTSSAEKQATGLLLSSYWYPRAAELRGEESVTNKLLPFTGSHWFTVHVTGDSFQYKLWSLCT